MLKNQPTPSVNFCFAKAEKWQAELRQLRTLVLDWGKGVNPKIYLHI
jgi:hypothetical protein